MIEFDKALLDTFTTVEVRSKDLDRGSRYTRTLDAANTYRLRDRQAYQTRKDDILGIHSVRNEGDLWTGYNADRFAIDVTIVGDGYSRYCLVAALSGAISMTSGRHGTTEAYGTKGLIFRGLPGTRFQTTDDAARLVLWVDAGRMERTLQAWLGEPPREMLAFVPHLDWSIGPAQAVWRMIVHLVEELRHPGGPITNHIKRETIIDLLLQIILNRLQHNYTAQLQRRTGTAIPAHLRRAEAFMHASADQPITMADVAAAAGCGAATLYAAFRQFRDTTPLSALHAIRLDCVRQALCSDTVDESIRTIARRFGFSNHSRFLTAYLRRFVEYPDETRRGCRIYPTHRSRAAADTSSGFIES